MSEFKSTTGKGNVKVLEVSLPKIGITATALTKMQLFVENCYDEIGWLGTAVKRDGYIVVEDVFLFSQEVHSTTTEITPEGLSDFAVELLKQENGVEIWNNMKVWGHSHVNMSVFASGQDDAQMNTFAESGHDWFIRIIANKKGEIKLDLYDYTSAIIYSDLPWIELVTEGELELLKQIQSLEKEYKKQMEELKKQQEAYKKARNARHEETIKEEIKVKVKKKVYSYTPPAYQRTGFHQQGVQTEIVTMTPTTTTREKDEVGGKKKDIATGRARGERGSWVNYIDDEDYVEYDVLNLSKDVYQWFDQSALMDIGECESTKQVREIIVMLGFEENFFSDADVRLIWAEGLKLAQKASGMR